MKYTATVYKDVIISKGISYIDCVAENEIALTKKQYETIPIPCKLIDGQFVPCDYPKIDAPEEKVPPVSIAQISTGSYVGNGDRYGGITLTFDFIPRVIFITGKQGNGIPMFATLINPSECGLSAKISNDYDNDYVTSGNSFKIIWTGKTVKFYSEYQSESAGSTNAMNAKNMRYEYIAIG